ncbi:hypothetical protein THAOC_06059 [Thalassiosira oceanica]|uniref:Uncharacterized protein n=1 Tax=Thalassiosira oceanica TaxID=159749 RepID=K0T5K1_THAOC|nr:hypothetical protein THAOC_06059 [Thalassiosira oceanica]|eukprot:EJK72414.1 hypothetical protein THAOC_06059 [Thalassiosira oceanica]
MSWCGYGTITYPQNVYGYRQYEGSLSNPSCYDMNLAGWYGRGTLTLTDGTKYSGEFLSSWSDGTKYEQMRKEKVDMYGEVLGTMFVPFVGKCVLPNNVTREGLFLLVAPGTRNFLSGNGGEFYLRDSWEGTIEDGAHNLQFEEWVDHHSLWLDELKVQSTTPLVLRDKDDK